MKRNFGILFSLVYGNLYTILYALGKVITEILIGIIILFTPIACFDLYWQRRVLTKQLMMRKDEVKREYKENEGDPQIKQERRRLSQEINSGNQLAKKATVVVANPTHYAVAIFYHPQRTPLPVVLIKGHDYNALEIIEIAREAGVPVVRNVLLARSLYRLVTPPSYIPTELIEPIAELIFAAEQIRRLDLDASMAMDDAQETEEAASDASTERAEGESDETLADTANPPDESTPPPVAGNPDPNVPPSTTAPPPAEKEPPP